MINPIETYHDQILSDYTDDLNNIFDKHIQRDLKRNVYENIGMLRPVAYHLKFDIESAIMIGMEDSYENVRT